MVGTERFQQLCSMEYLREYFKQVLGGKTIDLDMTYADATEAMQGILKTSGPISVYYAAAHEAKNAYIPEGDPGRPKINPDDTLMSVPDLAKQMGLEGSDAREGPQELPGHLCARLRALPQGQGLHDASCVHCTVNNLPQVYNPKAADVDKYSAQPFCVSRNFGDDVAFCAARRPAAREGHHRLATRRHRALQGRQRPERPSFRTSTSRRATASCTTSAFKAQPSAPRGRMSARWRCCPSTRCFVVIVADVIFDAKSATKYNATVEPDALRQGRPRAQRRDPRLSAGQGHPDHGRRARLPGAPRQVPQGRTWTRTTSRPSRWRPSAATRRRTRCSPTSA